MTQQNPQPQPQWGPPAPQKPRGSAKKVILIVLGSVVGLIVAPAIIGAIGGPPKTNNAASETTVVTKAATISAAIPSTAAKPSPKPDATTAKPSPTHTATKAAKVAATPSPSCTLPDDRDMYVWTRGVGVEDDAQEIGEADLSECITSVQLIMETSATGPGYCTEIGYVDQNPGYDVNATPAKPLKHIVDEVGAGC